MLAATINFIDEIKSGDDRRVDGERLSVEQLSTLRTPEREPLDIVVEDLSPRGFRFTATRSLPIGTAVRVGLSGAGVEDARIVWQDGSSYGCELVQPLSAARMAQAFTAAEVVFQRFDADQSPAPAGPETGKWPRRTRLATLLVGAAASWAVAVAVGVLVFG